MTSPVAQEPAVKKEVLIVGIDFGTTYSGVAWVSQQIRSTSGRRWFIPTIVAPKATMG